MKCTKKTKDTEEQEPLDWRVVHFYKKLSRNIKDNGQDIMDLMDELEEMRKKIERLERRIEKLEAAK